MARTADTGFAVAAGEGRFHHSGFMKRDSAVARRRGWGDSDHEIQFCAGFVRCQPGFDLTRKVMVRTSPPPSSICWSRRRWWRLQCLTR